MQLPVPWEHQKVPFQWQFLSGMMPEGGKLREHKGKKYCLCGARALWIECRLDSLCFPRGGWTSNLRPAGEKVCYVSADGTWLSPVWYTGDEVSFCGFTHICMSRPFMFLKGPSPMSEHLFFPGNWVFPVWKGWFPCPSWKSFRFSLCPLFSRLLE